MDEATVIAQIVANTQLGVMFDTEVDKDVPIDPDDYEIANAVLIVIEEGTEMTITPKPPEGFLSVDDYLPANVVWVP